MAFQPRPRQSLPYGFSAEIPIRKSKMTSSLRNPLQRLSASAPTAPLLAVPPPPLTTKYNISCAEIIQSKMKNFRKLFDVLSGGGGKTYPIFDKQEIAGQKSTSPLEYIVYFLISDGSFVSGLQVVVDSAMSNVPVTQIMSLGTCIVAEGVLRQPLAASAKQVMELEAEKLLHVGTVDPLSKKQLPLHLLRDFSHFRPRPTTICYSDFGEARFCVTRVHSTLTLASHTFIQSNGFQYVQVPVITTTGFGEMFRVTTLLGGETDDSLEKKHDGFNIDTSYASAIGKVYTNGPRFTADKIDNARHLAEMWNVETQMAFSELDDAMDSAD
ncbi:hypothetical protein Bca101_057725 [Brassica carinata]